MSRITEEQTRNIAAQRANEAELAVARFQAAILRATNELNARITFQSLLAIPMANTPPVFMPQKTQILQLKSQRNLLQRAIEWTDKLDLSVEDHETSAGTKPQASNLKAVKTTLDRLLDDKTKPEDVNAIMEEGYQSAKQELSDQRTETGDDLAAATSTEASQKQELEFDVIAKESFRLELFQRLNEIRKDLDLQKSELYEQVKRSPDTTQALIKQTIEINTALRHI